jgi:hypothetical protein
MTVEITFSQVAVTRVLRQNISILKQHVYALIQSEAVSLKFTPFKKKSAIRTCAPTTKCLWFTITNLSLKPVLIQYRLGVHSTVTTA